MSEKLLFLSHIHEEKELAIIIKSALEEEFSGFVDVFVSSDGSSIPAGSNFLSRIEDGLVSCIGALYLISPRSVRRNWINFELGAVWVRNAINVRDEKEEIPTIPICHSGMVPSQLPSPLVNLNAISSGQSSQLEFAFKSIQKAVGGKGKLRTDFDSLSEKCRALERKYTLGDNIKKMLSSLSGDMRQLIDHCEGLDPEATTTIDCEFVEQTIISMLIGLESNELSGVISVSLKNSVTQFGSGGAINGGNLSINIAAKSILEFKELLLA